jgi:hypothetical protein
MTNASFYAAHIANTLDLGACLTININITNVEEYFLCTEIQDYTADL